MNMTIFNHYLNVMLINVLSMPFWFGGVLVVIGVFLNIKLNLLKIGLA